MRRGWKFEAGSWKSHALGWGLLLLLATTAEAATYYVATDGMDAPGCGSQSTPCRHLFYTAGLMASGDTMAILPGTYKDYLYSDNGVDVFNNYGPGLPSGTASQPTTIKAANGPGTTVLQHDPSYDRPGTWVGGIGLESLSYVVINGLIFDGVPFGAGVGTSGRRSDHLTLQNSVLKNNGLTALNGRSDYLQVINNKFHDNGRDEEAAKSNCCYWPSYAVYECGDHQLWQGNEVYNSGGYGFHFNNAGAECLTNSVLANNTFHDNSIGWWDRRTCQPPECQGGIILNAGTNVLIYNNLFYNNNGACIRTGSGSGNKIYNNTCYDDIPGAAYINNGMWAYNNDIQNNIAWSLANENGNTGTENNNLWTNQTNPQFASTNPADPSFLRLQSTSPAIDRGSDLSNTIAAWLSDNGFDPGLAYYDFAGTPRPQGNGFDIGAYEYRTGLPLLRGDLNGDGKRDLADVRLLIYMLLGQQATTPEADLTNDGAVTLADLQALIRLMVGLP